MKEFCWEENTRTMSRRSTAVGTGVGAGTGVLLGAAVGGPVGAVVGGVGGGVLGHQIGSGRLNDHYGYRRNYPYSPRRANSQYACSCNDRYSHLSPRSRPSTYACSCADYAYARSSSPSYQSGAYRRDGYNWRDYRPTSPRHMANASYRHSPRSRYSPRRANSQYACSCL